MQVFWLTSRQVRRKWRKRSPMFWQWKVMFTGSRWSWWM